MMMLSLLLSVFVLLLPITECNPTQTSDQSILEEPRQRNIKVSCDGQFEYGVAYPHNDLNDGNSQRRESPEQCQELCKATPRCFGWTWGSNGNACWVKHTLGNKKTKDVEGRVSGKKNSCKATWTLVSRKNNCWSNCGNGKKGGLCENVCGTNGYCCRRGSNDCPSEAQQVALNTHHACVKSGAPVDWTQYPGALIRVSVGTAGVWGVNRRNKIYKKTSNGWKQIDGQLKDISVGKNSVWGVNNHDNIYQRSGHRWHQVAGKLVQVSVSGVNDNVVWGCNSNNNIYRQHGNSRTTWQQIGGKLKMVSCGESGVWGVNRNDNIYYRKGTFGGGVTAGASWQQVGGRLAWISSGSAGEVWGVNAAGDIYKRTGVSESNPVGTAWTKISGNLKQIDVFGGQVWGVNSQENIYTRGITGWNGLDGTCYIDDQARILQKKLGHLSDNTPSKCKSECNKLGYSLAGVQFGKTCWCGNNVASRAKIAPSNDCNMKCPGDGTVSCGGSWRMNIYSTNAGSCCDSLEISGPGIPTFEKNVPDTYSFYSMYNEKPVYKAKSREMYLFFLAESPARWVIEDIIGKKVNGRGSPVPGFIRHEGNLPCPEDVGNSWKQVWNRTVVDPRITVQCSGSVPDCTCSDYVNKNGYGNCRKQSVCYVNLPSTCSDLKQSRTDQGKWYSQDACAVMLDERARGLADNNDNIDNYGV